MSDVNTDLFFDAVRAAKAAATRKPRKPFVDIPDVTENGARLYDWYDQDGHITEAHRLTYSQAVFIFGTEQLREWTHVPHVAPGA